MSLRHFLGTADMLRKVVRFKVSLRIINPPPFIHPRKCPGPRMLSRSFFSLRQLEEF